MLFGKKKSKAKAAAPATIREALTDESSAAESAETIKDQTAKDQTAKDAAAQGEAAQGAAAQDAPAAQGPEQAEQTEQAEQAPEQEGAQRTSGASADARAEAQHTDESAADQAPGGPYDVSQIESRKGYVDFGSVLIPGGKDQKVRLDIDQKTRRVVALTISVGQASVQLQPFSAPKSGGTWDEVRQQIQESVVKQKGKVKEAEGRFGKELVARVPTTLKDGRSGWRVARFIGFEGDRWFLRGVVGGRGAIDRSAAKEVEDLFSRIVVVRGDDPMPPRELLQLQPPEGAKRVTVPRNPAQRRTDQSPNPAAADVSASGAADQ